MAPMASTTPIKRSFDDMVASEQSLLFQLQCVYTMSQRKLEKIETAPPPPPPKRKRDQGIWRRVLILNTMRHVTTQMPTYSYGGSGFDHSSSSCHEIVNGSGPAVDSSGNLTTTSEQEVVDFLKELVLDPYPTFGSEDPADPQLAGLGENLLYLLDCPAPTPAPSEDSASSLQQGVVGKSPSFDSKSTSQSSLSTTESVGTTSSASCKTLPLIMPDIPQPSLPALQSSASSEPGGSSLLSLIQESPLSSLTPLQPVATSTDTSESMDIDKEEGSDLQDLKPVSLFDNEAPVIGTAAAYLERVLGMPAGSLTADEVVVSGTESSPVMKTSGLGSLNSTTSAHTNSLIAPAIPSSADFSAEAVSSSVPSYTELVPVTSPSSFLPSLSALPFQPLGCSEDIAGPSWHHLKETACVYDFDLSLSDLDTIAQSLNVARLPLHSNDGSPAFPADAAPLPNFEDLLRFLPSSASSPAQSLASQCNASCNSESSTDPGSSQGASCRRDSHSASRIEIDQAVQVLVDL